MTQTTQNFVFANITIKDQNGNQLDINNYKAIQLDFPSPRVKNIHVTSSLGSFATSYENPKFQIVFPNQGSTIIWGSPHGIQTNWKELTKVDGNSITLIVNDATGSNSIQTISVQNGTTWTSLTLENKPSKVTISINFDGGPRPEPQPGELDEHGTRMFYKTTGRKVQLNESNHENGTRYNADHKFKNYMMIGYFKTGEGQKVIEMKTDGPCHGCNGKPAPVPIGMWYEPKIYVDDGKIELAGEWPHDPRGDWPNLRTDFTERIEGGIKKQWIGYAVVVYTNAQGQRVVEQWCAKNPFDSSDKPTNNWKMCLKAIEKGDGTMFAKKWRDIDITFPRDIDKVINYKNGNGFEAEIRMHGARKENGVDMKFGCVYEIIPPS
jgi:hypothetical protein